MPMKRQFAYNSTYTGPEGIPPGTVTQPAVVGAAEYRAGFSDGLSTLPCRPRFVGIKGKHINGGGGEPTDTMNNHQCAQTITSKVWE